jgi:thioredoxin 1
MSATLRVTDSSFEADVLNSKEPVVVDFWAEWCGPCRHISAAVDEIALDLQDQVKVGKLNVDENPAVTKKYGVRSIPTLMIFSGGQNVATKTGAATKTELSNWIRTAIRGAA